MSRIDGKILFWLLLAGLGTKIVVATENQNVNIFSLLKSPVIMSLSTGASWEKAGKTQTLNITSDVLKTYSADKSTDVFPTVGLFLGIQKPLSEYLLSRIGFELALTGNANLAGNIWDDADPQFNNYSYKYDIQHSHFVLKGQLLGDWKLPVLPWISASMGVGFNQAKNFTNTPTIFEAVAMPNFTNKITTAFTYTVGIGAQKQLTKNWQMGVGFEFADWGKSRLGKDAAHTMNQNLSLSHLYVQSVLFNLTYIA